MMWILPILSAYLLGSIPFGLLIPRLFGIADIRQHGSSNIGATNVTRVLGFRRALWVFVGDIAKGALAVLVGRWFAAAFPIPFVSLHHFLLVCALAAILGHLFPIFLRFKGGKGVNTALGTMLALLPLEALLAVVVFALVFALSRYVSLASMTAAIAFLGIILVEKYALGRDVATIYVWVSSIIVALIIYAHRSNIARLAAGTENRFDRRHSNDERRKAGRHV